MKSLFNKEDVSEIFLRIEKLTPSTQRQWGKMNISQMLAHCNIALQTAMGKHFVKRHLIGKLIGSFFKKSAFSDKEWSIGSPTDKSYIFPPDLNFNEQKTKLLNTLNEFHSGGPAKATTRPHAFFGKFTQDEWGVFEWKHLDHHLKQFGV